MEIINKKLSELKPYKKNPRNNDKTVKYLVNSIKEFGFKVPIVIDKNNVIVSGHTRYKAATELGLTEVPCIVADDLTEKQVNAFRIIDNKTSEVAQWNDDELSDDIRQIMEQFDMTNFGFGDFELSMLMEDMEPDEYDRDLIEQYSQHSEDFLLGKRLIIVYETEEEEEYIKKLLMETGKVLKIVYDVSEIKERYNE